MCRLQIPMVKRKADLCPKEMSDVFWTAAWPRSPRLHDRRHGDRPAHHSLVEELSGSSEMTRELEVKAEQSRADWKTAQERSK